MILVWSIDQISKKDWWAINWLTFIDLVTNAWVTSYNWNVFRALCSVSPEIIYMYLHAHWLIYHSIHSSSRPRLGAFFGLFFAKYGQNLLVGFWYSYVFSFPELSCSDNPNFSLKKPFTFSPTLPKKLQALVYNFASNLFQI